MITRLHRQSIVEVGWGGDQCTLYAHWQLFVITVSFFEREFIMPIGEANKITTLSTPSRPRCRIKMFGANRPIGHLACLNSMHTTYGFALCQSDLQSDLCVPHVCKPLPYAFAYHKHGGLVCAVTATLHALLDKGLNPK